MDALARLLDRHAPLDGLPLVPELRAHRARRLVSVWEAAERLAGHPLPAPFWAFPWPAGQALARVILDHPRWFAGRRVLDLGSGGGIAALAAARAGATEVTSNDIDPWALATAELTATRQGLSLLTMAADLVADRRVPDRVDVALCADLAYERRHAPRQRAWLRRARSSGARVFIADAGRRYFDATGLRELGRYRIAVPRDVEGVDERVASVFELI